MPPSRYEHEIRDSAGAHRFVLSIDEQIGTGEMVWPAQTSRLKNIVRIDETALLTWVVWPTMTLKCVIRVTPKPPSYELLIDFVATPYLYTVEDGGALQKFIAGLKLPAANEKLA
jgi:hypothetical protein